MTKQNQIDYFDACMLLDQAIADAKSEKYVVAEWGFSELEDLEKILRTAGHHYLAEKAAEELSAAKQRQIVPGVLFNGKPLSLVNFPVEDSAPAIGKHQKITAKSCPMRNRIIVPFWVYRRQFYGSTSLRKTG